MRTCAEAGLAIAAAITTAIAASSFLIMTLTLFIAWFSD
jgi:hypothetical protein